MKKTKEQQIFEGGMFNKILLANYLSNYFKYQGYKIKSPLN